MRQVFTKAQLVILWLSGVAVSVIWTSIFDHIFRVFAKEVYSDSPEVLMRLGWRDFIKTL